jgi:hypothetical protein
MHTVPEALVALRQRILKSFRKILPNEVERISELLDDTTRLEGAYVYCSSTLPYQDHLQILLWIGAVHRQYWMVEVQTTSSQNAQETQLDLSIWVCHETRVPPAILGTVMHGLHNPFSIVDAIIHGPLEWLGPSCGWSRGWAGCATKDGMFCRNCMRWEIRMQRLRC